MYLYKNYNAFLNFKKFYLYKNLINFYKLSLSLQLLYSYQFKYSWIDTKTKFDKFYFNNIENYFFVDFFQNTYVNNFFEKCTIIENYINCKNKYGFFKKINSIRGIFLIKNNFFKNNFEPNFNNTSSNLIFKNFDFVERKLFFFKNNRKVLKNIFKKNKKINHFMNVFLKKITKVNFLNFLNLFEFSIINVLLNSGLFLNKNDIIFFIKDKSVYLNNKVITNSTFEVSKGDIISVCYNKYFYFLYRRYLNKLNLNINKYNNFFKKGDSDLKNDFNFLNKSILIKNDVPSYIEVDYISMSLIIVYKNIHIVNYNCFDLKLLTSFLRRLNSWKYIV